MIEQNPGQSSLHLLPLPSDHFYSLLVRAGRAVAGGRGHPEPEERLCVLEI